MKCIRFLQNTLPEASTGFLYKMLRKKNIKLNDAKCDGTEVLHQNDHIKIFFSDETFLKLGGKAVTSVQINENIANPSNSNTNSDSLKQNQKHSLKLSDQDFQDLSRRILYENEDFLFLNKKSGELSQKAHANDVSINEMLIAFLEKRDHTDFSRMKPSVINRLDRNTSGIILFGKTVRGLQTGAEIMRTHDGNKCYHAICVDPSHRIPEQKTVMEGYLVKDQKSNTVQFHKNEISNSKYMKQTVRVLKRSGDLCLVEIVLHTGRSHQIRVSLAHIGAPVLMDSKYGIDAENQKYRSIFMRYTPLLLHSYSFRYEGQGIVAPEPAYFEKVMR